MARLGCGALSLLALVTLLLLASALSAAVAALADALADGIALLFGVVGLAVVWVVCKPAPRYQPPVTVVYLVQAEQAKALAGPGDWDFIDATYSEIREEQIAWSN